MNSNRDNLTESIRAYIFVALGVSTFSLAILPHILYFTYANQFEISLIISVTFFISIISYFFGRSPNKEKYAYFEFLFYTVAVGLIIHYISYLKGPLIFMYGLVILSASYFLKSEFLNYISGIASLFVVAEYFLLTASGEIELTTISATYLFLRIFYLALLGKFGKSLAVGVQAQRKQFLQLLKLNEELTEIDKLKREFIDIASHQLKTPLTAIKGNMAMIQDGDFGTVGKNLQPPLTEIDLGTRRLSTVIDDVVDSLKFEQNIPLKLRTEIADFQSLVKSEVESFLPNAWAKNLKLRVKSEKQIPNFLLDKEKIKIVLSIFVENAINHSLKGGQVKVTVSKENDQAVVKVRDEGPGVITKELNKIIKTKAKKIRKEELDKIGLNVYLARKIIESHGGEIFFEDGGKIGNVSGFTLPLNLVDKKKRQRIMTRHA